MDARRPVRLMESLREAVDGGSPISPEVARRVITLFRDVRPPQRADYELTPHETRLRRMLVDGHNYKTALMPEASNRIDRPADARCREAPGSFGV